MGALQDRIQGDVKVAMKAGEKDKLTVLRMVMATLKAAAEDSGGDLDDAAVTAVVTKAVKTRKDTIDQAQAAGRQDVIEREQAEIVILEAYLPEQLTGDKLLEKVREVAGEVGYGGPADKGKFMKAWMAQYKGQADGRDVQQALGQLG